MQVTPKIKKRKLIINLIFWSSILILAFISVGPDLRFGPDFRLNSKIIDPDKAAFVANNVKFEDYNNYNDLALVLSRIIPKGTDKAEIQNFFEKQSHSFQVMERPYRDEDKTNPQQENIEIILHYELPRLYTSGCFLSLGGKRDTFVFHLDEKKKLLSFYIRNGCGIFSSKG